MCELLGMNANAPTDLRFSFTGLCKRGGETGPHTDGWGIAFHFGKVVQAFHDPQASAVSDLARFVRSFPIKSLTAVAHVRRANRGKIALENTHPFTRELWGRMWSFAHNGQLKGVKKLPLRTFRPLGATDSEHAFCWILDRLRASFDDLPVAERLDRAVAELCREIAPLGVFNMLMSDGRSLYAFCGKNMSILTRQAPFGAATLVDSDARIDFSTEAGGSDRIIVVATHPLTRDETWTRVAPGALLAMRNGAVRRTYR
jgi:glutamine amidotransferase